MLVCFEIVQLVERNVEPSGYTLLNAHRVGKHDATDIVELARQIQTADDSIKHLATGKLTLILEQVKCWFVEFRFFFFIFSLFSFLD